MGKMFDLLKKEILFKQARTQVVMQLKSTHYLHLSKASEQLLSSKLLSRTTPNISKLRANSLWLQMTHAMDMILPCKHKGLVP